MILRKTAIAFAIMLTVSSTGMVFAGDVYKWIDEDGNVHYGDRPTIVASEKPPAVSSELTNSSKDQADNEVKVVANEPVEPALAELSAHGLEAEEKCATYKASLHELLVSRRQYQVDDNGERVSLDEDESMAAREHVQNQVEEYCNF